MDPRLVRTGVHWGTSTPNAVGDRRAAVSNTSRTGDQSQWAAVSNTSCVGEEVVEVNRRRDLRINEDHN